MNLLMIGNSFSSDATYYVKKIADSAGADLKVVNLYIGGCSLKTHAENIENNAPLYRYEINGIYTDKYVSVADTLKEENWDIVTVQQQSGHTGVYDSYGEYFKTVLNCIKENAGGAQIYFFQTWAYEIDSTHENFCFYDNDQEKMHEAIVKTVKTVCKENGDLPIIPAGEVINTVRKHPLFDYKNGGQSLCRDGFHMHLVYGRYLLGLVLFAKLLGGDADEVKFIPTEADIVNGYEVENFSCDLDKIDVIKATVKKMI